MKKQEVTKELIAGVLEKGIGRITSLSDISRALGYKGAISGSLSKKIRQLVPHIDDLLRGNRAVQEQDKKPTDKPNKKPKSKSADTKPVKASGNHADGNPYRAGSNYAVVFDCLAKMGKDKPVSRKDLVKKVCEISGKDEKHVGYDLSVVLSPSKDGKSHRNAVKPGRVYWVERLEHSTLQLHMR